MHKIVTAGVDLLWLPLGAGGWFVRFNGRIWETIQAHKQHRQRCALYHTALIVHVPEAYYVIENAWPIPDTAGATRGVVAEGAVFTHWLGFMRVFRYEVRCWRNGIIDDAAWAVESPQRLSSDEATARRVLNQLPAVPTFVWGRQVSGSSDMWNSNSTIAWVLTASGVSVDSLVPPAGGRAPGWNAGITVAQHARF